MKLAMLSALLCTSVYAQTIGYAKWTTDASNFVKLWDFTNSSDVSYWGISGSVPQTDGIKINTSCQAHTLSKNFTDPEISDLQNANYFVVEKGFSAQASYFTINYRNTSNHASTGSVTVSDPNWGTPTNPLQSLGMFNVVAFKDFIPSGYELSGIGYTENLSLSLCAPGVHYYTRAYFSKNNPVPKTGATQAFAGQTKKANVIDTIPIDLNTRYCTNCALTLDNSSVSKGMSISGNALRWQPRNSNVGSNSGSVTLKVSGVASNTAAFSITVQANSVISPMAGILVR